MVRPQLQAATIGIQGRFALAEVPQALSEEEVRFGLPLVGNRCRLLEEPGGPFELVNAQGETVTDADVFTEPSLVYFGYTFCPDVCPFDVSRNAEAVDLLAERGISVTPVFISIDPERDTPEVVGEYAEVMHEKAIGLSGKDGGFVRASKVERTTRDPESNIERAIDLGFVGQPVPV